MESMIESERQTARGAGEDHIAVLLHDKREEVLRGLLENPALRELHLCLLLGRRDLSTALLDEVAKRSDWMRSYRVRRALAFHPNVPHALGMQLVRELYTSDLVELTFSSSGQPALRQLSQELVLAKLPQLPIAQKTRLARRGPPRIVGALLADGAKELMATLLDSPRLNEGHVLKALARIALPPPVVAAVANHARWSSIYSVRLALLRNSHAPFARVVTFLPSISTSDLRLLSRSNAVPAKLQPHIRRELTSRAEHGKTAAQPK